MRLFALRRAAVLAVLCNFTRLRIRTACRDYWKIAAYAVEQVGGK